MIIKTVSKVTSIFFLQDQVPAATSPLSSPSDYSPCQAPALSESSQSAHRFLQAVFNKKGESGVFLPCGAWLKRVNLRYTKAPVKGALLSAFASQLFSFYLNRRISRNNNNILNLCDWKHFDLSALKGPSLLLYSGIRTCYQRCARLVD